MSNKSNSSKEELMKLVDEDGLDEILSSRELLSVQDVLAELEVTEKGFVKQTTDNYVIALMKDPTLSGKIRFNELLGQVDIYGEVPWNRQSNRLIDSDVDHIMYHLEKTYELNKDKTLRRALNIVANKNSFHPIRERLQSLEWDGVVLQIKRCSILHFI